MFYDTLLLIALFMVLTALLLAILPGNEVTPAVRPWYQAGLLLAGLGFFALFWRFGGQTLGMRAWRLQVRGEAGRISWSEAWLRASLALVSFACLGLGFIWSLIDRERLTWHDRLSRTRLIVVGKSANEPVPVKGP